LGFDRDVTDISRFERRLEAGREALRTRRARRALRLLEDALGLWRGAAFADLPYAEFVMHERERLDELRLEANELVTESRLALGQARELIAELEAVVDQEPYRERSWSQLMRALYLSGRQADALAAYRRARARLEEDLGIDPSAELQELERRILVQDASLNEAADPDAGGADRPPAPPTPIVGRGDELGDIVRFLREGRHRLVTLTGPPGIGKTRLAQEVAIRLDGELVGGARFVRLASVRDPAAVLGAIATAVDASAAERDQSLERVAAMFVRPALLVLDNLEQLGGPATAISDLLGAAPELRILATSRTPLRLRGERQVELDPLPDESATDLFVMLAADAGARIERDGSVRELCRRLDNLPLAIEIVAARAGRMPPISVLGHLAATLDIAGPVDAEARQQTLRSAIAWSHDLLSAEHRRLFRQLAAFHDGATLEAAELVCAASVEALEVLVDHHLVAPIAGRTAERYGSLETIRRFAREQLETSGEERATAERHLSYYEGLGQRFESEAGAGDVGTWFMRLDDEWLDVQAAVRFACSIGDGGRAARLCRSIRDYVRARASSADALAITSVVLATPDLPDEERVPLLYELYVLEARQGHTRAATEWAAAALDLARSIGQPRQIALASYALAMLAGEEGDEARESTYIEMMQSAAREAHDSRLQLVASAHLALRTLRQGEYDRAVDLYTQVVAAMSSVNVMRESLAAAVLNLGIAALHAGRLEPAASSLARCSEISRELRDFDTFGYLLEAYAALAMAVGDAALAAQLQGAAAAALEVSASALEAFEAAMRDRTETRARAQLGDDQFVLERAVGSRLEVDAALDLGLEMGRKVALATER
jgi:predicted ATPase